MEDILLINTLSRTQ